MFRAFIVFLEIVVLIMVLQTSFAQHWLSDWQNGLSAWLLTMSGQAEQVELSGLQRSLQDVTNNLKDYQQDYVHDVLSSKARLNDFHQMYCVAGDKNPYVYGDNLKQICQQIRHSRFLHNSV